MALEEKKSIECPIVFTPGIVSKTHYVLLTSLLDSNKQKKLLHLREY